MDIMDTLSYTNLDGLEIYLAAVLLEDLLVTYACIILHI